MTFELFWRLNYYDVWIYHWCLNYYDVCVIMMFVLLWCLNYYDVWIIMIKVYDKKFMTKGL